MTHIESVAVNAQATFGRDGAMFESLLGFVAQLSVVVWSLVVLTAVIRFVGIRIYRRGAARAALVETVTLSAAVRTTTGLRTERLSAAHGPALRRQLHGGVSMDISLMNFWLPSPATSSPPQLQLIDEGGIEVQPVAQAFEPLRRP